VVVAPEPGLGVELRARVGPRFRVGIGIRADPTEPARRPKP
jgi:hypothetical protein